MNEATCNEMSDFVRESRSDSDAFRLAYVGLSKRYDDLLDEVLQLRKFARLIQHDSLHRFWFIDDMDAAANKINLREIQERYQSSPPQSSHQPQP